MSNWGGEVLAATLNAVCQGLGITLAAWAVLSILRPSAATRYAIWLATLIIVALLPVFNLVITAHAPQPVLAGAAVSRIPVISLPATGAWVSWIGLAWAAISGAMLIRLVFSYLALQRCKRRASPLRVAASGLPGVALLESDDISVPVAAGFGRPAVLIPRAVAEELAPQELDSVLTHELAHLRRRDDWTNLLARAIQAALFFHPAVWIIGRRLSVEREIACDDSVLAAAGEGRPYAACLLKLARSRSWRDRPRLAPAAIARKREISIRIEALLDRARNAAPSCSKPVFAGAVLLLIAGAGLLAPLALFAAADPIVAAPAARAAAISVPATAMAKSPATAMAAVRPRRVADAPLRQLLAKARPAQAAAPVGARQPLRQWTVEVFYFEAVEPAWVQVVWVQRAPEAPRVGGI